MQKNQYSFLNETYLLTNCKTHLHRTKCYVKIPISPEMKNFIQYLVDYYDSYLLYRTFICND